MNPRTARYLNLVVGVWLFLSAFLWSHSSAQMTNTWLMGVIVVAIAAMATATSNLRFVNTLAGAWLIVSAFVLPTISSGTRWNNFIVGIVVGLLSLVASSAARVPHPIHTL